VERSEGHASGASKRGSPEGRELGVEWCVWRGPGFGDAEDRIFFGELGSGPACVGERWCVREGSGDSEIRWGEGRRPEGVERRVPGRAGGGEKQDGSWCGGKWGSPSGPAGREGMGGLELSNFIC